MTENLPPIFYSTTSFEGSLMWFYFQNPENFAYSQFEDIFLQGFVTGSEERAIFKKVILFCDFSVNFKDKVFFNLSSLHPAYILSLEIYKIFQFLSLPLPTRAIYYKNIGFFFPNSRNSLSLISKIFF